MDIYRTVQGIIVDDPLTIMALCGLIEKQFVCSVVLEKRLKANCDIHHEYLLNLKIVLVEFMLV